MEHLDLFAVSVMTLLCVFLGLGQVAMKIANQEISPWLQGGLRSAAAAGLIGLWAAFRRIRLFVADRTAGPMFLAALFFTLEFAFLYPGLERTSASRAVIFLYTSPLVVAVGAHFLIPGDRMTWPKAIGLIVAFSGVVLVLSARDTSGKASLEGDLLCLAAGISWGFLTLTSRGTRLATLAPERVVFFEHLMTGAVLVAGSFLIGERGIGNPTWLHWGAFAWTTVFVAFIAFVTSFALMLRYPASKIMAFMLLTPIVGVAAGALILGEPLTTSLFVGLGLVLAGLWLINRPPSGNRRKVA
jgi:drug/metabolite transporter (DMT)-like permease